MSETKTLPPVKWAQTDNDICLTFEVQDLKEVKVNIRPTGLSFSGTSNGKEYAGDFTFLHEVDTEKCTWKVLDRATEVQITKKIEARGFWKQLLQDKALEKTNVRTDWSKFVDEDDANDGEFDMSTLGGAHNLDGMGGMGGLGRPGDGADELDDSDDDSLSDIDKPGDQKSP